MRVLIVGADRMGNITSKLRERGFEEITHWCGRSKTFWKKSIPIDVAQVIIFCDFIDHNTMRNVRQQAKANDIPIVYSKRAISHQRLIV
ncbi:hypothetical protein Sgly_2791 [Syntrophobotulus glycolicus DSM 8271]|uniref:Dihydroorotate dehydrogenase n=2 Tax=Syntrophobotulus TaxID=51196 RepID=F0SYF0_SYNGF|nr:hypothetical protein Sgly_2791 [Syntrophobotulus glycolicus DSM 8271]